MKETTCCVFGHRSVKDTQELRAKITRAVEKLITEDNVDTFFFGSKSNFDSLCLELVTELKEKYPHIKRIYVRAEFPDIDKDYLYYLLEFYDDTYYPEKLRSAGKAAYIERNREMINKSRFCIVYYDADNTTAKKSGTKAAFDLAVKKGRIITNLYF